jgi:hypothetical protein
MADFTALLIGAAEYDDEGIDSLPFITEETSALAGILEDAG